MLLIPPRLAFDTIVIVMQNSLNKIDYSETTMFEIVRRPRHPARSWVRKVLQSMRAVALHNRACSLGIGYVPQLSELVMEVSLVVIVWMH